MDSKKFVSPIILKTGQSEIKAITFINTLEVISNIFSIIYHEIQEAVTHFYEYLYLY